MSSKQTTYLYAYCVNAATSIPLQVILKYCINNDGRGGVESGGYMQRT